MKCWREAWSDQQVQLVTNISGIDYTVAQG
jgi:hypothetical protein